MFAGILTLLGLNFSVFLDKYILFCLHRKNLDCKNRFITEVELYLELCPQSSKYVSTLSNKLFIMKTTFLVSIAFR